MRGKIQHGFGRYDWPRFLGVDQKKKRSFLTTRMTFPDLFSKEDDQGRQPLDNLQKKVEQKPTVFFWATVISDSFYLNKTILKKNTATTPAHQKTNDIKRDMTQDMSLPASIKSNCLLLDSRYYQCFFCFCMSTSFKDHGLELLKSGWKKVPKHLLPNGGLMMILTACTWKWKIGRLVSFWG